MEQSRATGKQLYSLLERSSLTIHKQNNFLVAISGPICRTRDSTGVSFLLPEIGDAVVQDANDSEGTGVWANANSVLEHIPAPSLTAAHYLRVASANISHRQAINKVFGSSDPASLRLEQRQIPDFLVDLHQAVYASVLACFIQGLDLLVRKSERENWQLNLEEILRIWRAGCIIKSDYITDLFERHYAQLPGRHPLAGPEISVEAKRNLPALKRVVLRAIEADAHIPALGSSLDYFKYSGSLDLPTNFVEAQLDAFGAHGYELKGEQNADMSKGKRHSAWSQN
jgi:6-phosphogluconate dehydrogenase